MMEKDACIFVAGHHGMVGSALVRVLKRAGFENLVVRTRQELDLRDAAQVSHFFAELKPKYVFLAAAKVGGIVANSSFPAEFIYDNLAIQNNVIHQAFEHRVQKLLFLGSSCIYPRDCVQPIREEYLLTGLLEPTNECYAIAKIAGIKMCQAYRRQYGCNFIAAMPPNLYGQEDNFDLETAHVIPALLRKFHEAKETGGPVTLWGTGSPRREFLFVDDAAEGCIFLMNQYSDGQIMNLGSGQDLTIAALANLISDVVGYQGKVIWDSSKPDGTPRKLLDSSRFNALGWRPTMSLEEGLTETYRWYKENSDSP